MEIKSKGIPSKKVIVFSRFFFAESLAKKSIMTIKQNGKQAGKNKTVELGDLGIGYQPKTQDLTVLNIVEYTHNIDTWSKINDSN